MRSSAGGRPPRRGQHLSFRAGEGAPRRPAAASLAASGAFTFPRCAIRKCLILLIGTDIAHLRLSFISGGINDVTATFRSLRLTLGSLLILVCIGGECERRFNRCGLDSRWHGGRACKWHVGLRGRHAGFHRWKRQRWNYLYCGLTESARHQRRFRDCITRRCRPERDRLARRDAGRRYDYLLGRYGHESNTLVRLHGRPRDIRFR